MATIKRQSDGLVEIRYERVAVKPTVIDLPKVTRTYQYCREASDQALIERFRAMDMREQILIVNEFIKMYGGEDGVRTEKVPDMRQGIHTEEQGTGVLRVRVSEGVESGECEKTNEGVYSTETRGESQNCEVPGVRKRIREKIRETDVLRIR